MLYSTTAKLALAAMTAGIAQAKYTIESTFDASNFFDEMNFFSASDPTNGHVNYVDRATAESLGLAAIKNGAVYMGADYAETNPSGGRKSVRVATKKAWTHGLFIGDFAHMPAASCGTWPAFWSTLEADWPNSGEIDILEGVSTQESTAVTLHTSQGCTINNDGTDSTTTLKGTDCGASGASVGCSQMTSNTQNYGDGFNAIGGGIYAMEWNSDFIAVWFFPRSSIPADITAGSPDPTTWAKPAAKFNGGSGCNIDSYFKEHNVIFTNTFCGDWAGAVWNENAECSALASTCVDYVSNNPAAFKDAYWLVNSVKVYTEGGDSPSPSSSSTPSASSPSTPKPTTSGTPISSVPVVSSAPVSSAPVVSATSAPRPTRTWSWGGRPNFTRSAQA
ncbi:unnamed protein product [Clonostachys rhizophaga]|uniref:endo-1,3(4)-beta-glucanase n=1 Tax=Clonostachys rhizophaga TaxID=160324 RepID=A0A9N9YQA4_9HYPO|nr:unnamed protein product [Clonostachys rhizophaga]